MESDYCIFFLQFGNSIHTHHWLLKKKSILYSVAGGSWHYFPIKPCDKCWIELWFDWSTLVLLILHLWPFSFNWKWNGFHSQNLFSRKLNGIHAKMIPIEVIMNASIVWLWQRGGDGDLIFPTDCIHKLPAPGIPSFSRSTSYNFNSVVH